MRDIVLNREQVIDRPVVTLGPDVAAGGGFDELGGHANPLAQRLDAALKNIFHVEVATYLADVDRLALVDLGGIASDDEKVLRVGEIGDDVLGDPICEPRPLGVVPNIDEGKDRQRGPTVQLSNRPLYGTQASILSSRLWSIWPRITRWRLPELDVGCVAALRQLDADGIVSAVGVVVFPQPVP